MVMPLGSRERLACLKQTIAATDPVKMAHHMEFHRYFQAAAAHLIPDTITLPIRTLLGKLPIVINSSFSKSNPGFCMVLDKKDIEKIAWLARLDMNAADIPGYVRDLSSILELVEQMNQVVTTNIEPLAHPLQLTARVRPDVITETNQREHFQQCAPLVAKGHYLVPKVLE